MMSAARIAGASSTPSSRCHGVSRGGDQSGRERRGTRRHRVALDHQRVGPRGERRHETCGPGADDQRLDRGVEGAAGGPDAGHGPRGGAARGAGTARRPPPAARSDHAIPSPPGVGSAWRLQPRRGPFAVAVPRAGRARRGMVGRARPAAPAAPRTPRPLARAAPVSTRRTADIRRVGLDPPPAPAERGPHDPSKRRPRASRSSVPSRSPRAAKSSIRSAKGSLVPWAARLR